MSGPNCPGKLIVVGAGAAGLSAAWSAARMGFDVVCLDANGVGAETASSAGWMKILRYAYDDIRYAALMTETEPRWRFLEKTFGHSLIEPCPSLNFGSRQSPVVQRLRNCLDAVGRKSVLLEWDDERTSALGGLAREGEAGVVELDAGLMKPATVLRALRRAAESSGVQLREHTPALTVSSRAGGVRVDTPAGRLDADCAVVAAGPWTPRLLPGLAGTLTVTRQVQTLFTTGEPMGDGSLFSWAEVAEDTFYGACNLDGGRHVIGTHALGEAVDPGTPRDPGTEDKAVLAQLEFLAGRTRTGTRITPIATRVCHYTSTADGDFLIERHQPRVVALSACSGHGFKFSVTTGHQAAQLAASLV